MNRLGSLLTIGFLAIVLSALGSTAHACFMYPISPAGQPISWNEFWPDYTGSTRRTRNAAWVVAGAGTIALATKASRSRRLWWWPAALCGLVTVFHPAWTVPIRTDSLCQVHGSASALVATAFVVCVVLWQGWRHDLKRSRDTFVPQTAV